MTKRFKWTPKMETRLLELKEKHGKSNVAVTSEFNKEFNTKLKNTGIAKKLAGLNKQQPKAVKTPRTNLETVQPKGELVKLVKLETIEVNLDELAPHELLSLGAQGYAMGASHS